VTTVLIVIVLALVAASATMVVLTRDPFRQTIVLGIYGLTLAVAFVAFQAPDVALSISAVQVVALPLMILVALAKTGGGPR
jgi:energy-converting hydrogenase B subunit D